MNFTFLNIPVRIQPTFWIFLLFFSNIYSDVSIESLIVGCVMLFSVLLHEYGHALTAAYFGAKPDVTLEAFGGYAKYNTFGISRGQQLLITINGPLFESLLIALPYFLLESRTFAGYYYIQYTFYVTMKVNILWCLLNIIPVAPLDGGHIVRSLLESKFEDSGYKTSLIIGLISVVLIAPYLLFEGYTFFGTFLILLGFQNYQNLKNCKSGASGNTHFSSLMKGLEATNSNDNIEAKKIFKKLLKSKDTYIKHSATEALAKIYFHENEGQKSYELLMDADHHSLHEGKHLLCKLAFERKNYEVVVAYSRDIYTIDPSYETALLILGPLPI